MPHPAGVKRRSGHHAGMRRQRDLGGHTVRGSQIEPLAHGAQQGTETPVGHVRRNAADALRLLGVTDDDVRSVQKTGDRYAIEMLSYALSLKGGRP